MKTTTEKAVSTIQKTRQASKMPKQALRSLSMKPVRSIKRVASLKVRPIVLPLTDKEAP